MLAGGLVIVDTPGVGGLGSAHAAGSLAAIAMADAVVFVTDASAELSGPELEFLASARGAGPPVLVAVTKIDMYPEWRRIVDIDVGHLAAIGLVERPFPLSSVLRSRPDERDDEMEEIRWFPLERALKRAAYRGERDVLGRAADLLR